MRTKNIAGKKLAINKNKVDRFEGSFDLAVDLDNDLNTINQTSPDVINARPSSETQKDRTEWAILGLGLEEPLPPREMMEEL